MLSRVAENLYWISRYVERAENVARLLDDGFHLELDAAGLAGDADGRGPVEGVLAILACRTEFALGHDPGDREAALEFLTFDRRNRHSIVAMLARARESARSTQEALSAEAWGQVNRMYLGMTAPKARRRFLASPSRFFEGVKRACILFDGLVDSTMPRSEAYHFLQLGRYLERANQVSRVLAVKLRARAVATVGDGPDEDDPEAPLRAVYWSSLLRSCSAHEAYLREHRDRMDPAGVVSYLVLDPDFPRALRYCVARCCDSLRDLAGPRDDDDYSNEAERLLGRLDSELRYVDVDEIFRQGLARFLNSVQDTCHRVGDEIHQAYFLT